MSFITGMLPVNNTNTDYTKAFDEVRHKEILHLLEKLDSPPLSVSSKLSKTFVSEFPYSIYSIVIYKS